MTVQYSGVEDMVPIKNKPLFLQVEEFVRAKMASGEYPVNGKLPPTDVLAAITQTSVCTVQSALSKLCREGLLERKPKRGTFVRGKKAVLTCAGLYLSRPFPQANAAFYQVLVQEICERLAARGIKTRVWTDDREPGEQTGPMDSLKRAMEQRDIQALIAPLIGEHDLQWLQQAPVPTAVLSTDLTLKNGVSTDLLNSLRLSLAELKRQGCRSVGVISHLTMTPPGSHSLESSFYGSLTDLIGEQGLETRNEWIRLPAQPVKHLAHFGYEEFQNLWNLRERPEGLLVFPDELVNGVIMAILDRRLDMPKDLKVVFHANDRIPYVCPFQASFLVAEMGRFAEALIGGVQSQLAGAPPSHQHIQVATIRDFSFSPI